jgi:hypothetical protein
VSTHTPGIDQQQPDPGAIERAAAALHSARDHGWEFAEDPQAGVPVWRLRKDGLTLHVTANRHWLCFTLPLASRSELSLPYTDYLLRLCCSLFMCRYGLDAADRLSLQLELPLAGLDRGYVHTAVAGITAYARRHDVAPPSAGNEDWQTAAAEPADHRDAPGYSEVPLAGADAPSRAAGAVPDDGYDHFPAESLEFYFATVGHSGWYLKSTRARPQSWHAVYRGHDRIFDAYLSFNGSWAYFQTPMLGDACADSGWSATCSTTLRRYLLQVNEQLYWARFGMDEAGRVLLLLDIPLGMFDLDRFELATRTLARYADEYAYDIQVLAGLERDPVLRCLLTE